VSSPFSGCFVFCLALQHGDVCFCVLFVLFVWFVCLFSLCLYYSVPGGGALGGALEAALGFMVLSFCFGWLFVASFS
jgi:uncharacterized BrkB/YihY/UPF0761 family membrane protein